MFYMSEDRGSPKEGMANSAQRDMQAFLGRWLLNRALEEK